MDRAYTCINCCVKFATAEIQRNHYKTDWHCFNLKRRVCGLMPVSSEEFMKRVLHQRTVTALEVQETKHYCKICRKQFANNKSYMNHINSKKHNEYLNRSKREESHNLNETVTIFDAPIDEKVQEVNDKLQSLSFAEYNCIFCTHKSVDITQNLNHMYTAHSFYIPESSSCIDVHGLLVYLVEKVKISNMCLWCNERRTFNSLDSVRKHMVDKGHCQLFDEDMATSEYKSYYDFSANGVEKTANVDIKKVEDDIEIDNNPDGCFIYEIVLPSGAVIGHRSLLRYYKQFLKDKYLLIPKTPVHKEQTFYKREMPIARWHPLLLGEKLRP